MKIEKKEHYNQKWIVHDLLADFEIEDVWQFPVRLEEKHTIPMFQTQLFGAMEKLSKKGIAGLLFKIRFLIGSLFGWDKPVSNTPNDLKAGSIRERYSQQYKVAEIDLIPVGKTEFKPVYKLDNESLAEIENQTVAAGLHLSKVPLDDAFTVQMAVYVKPKGLFGKGYMALIKPFRLFIVYPMMMKIVGKNWEDFLKKN